MPAEVEYKPVQDDVPKVDGKVAVGEDLEFQRRWWRFENFVWAFFVLVLIADLSGILGRGPLSKKDVKAADGSIEMKYEDVQRANTSSIITLTPANSVEQSGAIQLYVSNEVLTKFGAQRIIPEPERSVLGSNGVTYTFPATTEPLVIQIELKPSFIGMHPFSVAIPGHAPIQAKAFVLP